VSETVLRLAANPVKARLFDADREAKVAVSELLSYEVEGADRTDAFKSRRWDGRSSFFDFRLATFPAGFVPIVYRELSRRGHKVQIFQKPLPAPLGLPDTDFANFDGRDTALRDYQPETVRSLLRHGRMIAQVATGGGKSRIAAMAVAALRRPTLFLTTRAVLMHQMAEGFAAAGFTPGVIGDGIWAPRKGVNVGMVQTIVPRLAEDHPEREKTLRLLSYFEFVIGEEAHEAGGSSYFDILSNCPNAAYRLALTATPFMRPDAEANMRLMAAFGPIGIQVTEKLLIERGILAEPQFKIIRCAAPQTLRRSTRWPTCYDLGVVQNEDRNRAIIREVHRAASHNLPVMVLVQRKKHGQILETACLEAGIRARFIFGEHENQTRQSALQALAKGEIQALIGSTILDVGVDVPAVGMVVLAGAGKAEVAHRQRIGRGLRAKRSGPNVCFVVDFADEANRILHEHALTRRAILEGTPGFAERLLPEGSDFDYDQFQTEGAFA
jgi:superfamily II DNA or RNA helicase